MVPHADAFPSLTSLATEAVVQAFPSLKGQRKLFSWLDSHTIDRVLALLLANGRITGPSDAALFAAATDLAISKLPVALSMEWLSELHRFQALATLRLTMKNSLRESQLHSALLSLAPTLRSLDLSGTVCTLTPSHGASYHTFLAGLTRLQELRLSGLRIQAIQDGVLPTSLTLLDLSGTQYEPTPGCDALTSISELRHLDASGTYMSDILLQDLYPSKDRKGLSSLTYLDVSWTRVSAPPAAFPSLRVLRAANLDIGRDEAACLTLYDRLAEDPQAGASIETMVLSGSRMGQQSMGPEVIAAILVRAAASLARLDAACLNPPPEPSALGKCTALVSLNISDACPPHATPYLSDMRRLTELSLGTNNHLRPQDLLPISSLPLARLDLSRCPQLTSQTLYNLAPLGQTLVWMDVSGTSVGAGLGERPAAPAAARQGPPRTTTPPGPANPWSAFSRLESLKMSHVRHAGAPGVEALSDADVAALVPLGHCLTQLAIGSVAMSDAGLRGLVKGLTGLKELSLAAGSNVSLRGLKKSLGSMTTLESLTIKPCFALLDNESVLASYLSQKLPHAAAIRVGPSVEIRSDAGGAGPAAGPRARVVIDPFYSPLLDDRIRYGREELWSVAQGLGIDVARILEEGSTGAEDSEAGEPGSSVAGVSELGSRDHFLDSKPLAQAARLRQMSSRSSSGSPRSPATPLLVGPASDKATRVGHPVSGRGSKPPESEVAAPYALPGMMVTPSGSEGVGSDQEALGLRKVLQGASVPLRLRS